MNKKSYSFKVVVVGDYGVGKTTLISRFVENKFRSNYIPTLGVQISKQSFELNESHIDLMIWDIAGQESFVKVRQRFYQESEGFFIVFDTTRKSSLEHIGRWYREVLEFTGTGATPCILIGNKIDLKEELAVSDDEIISTLIDNDMYVEMIIKTSAKTGKNVDDVFQTLGERILQKFRK
ncbi:MAG: Rab family GTPase [Promethearchaeota archaeon]